MFIVSLTYKVELEKVDLYIEQHVAYLEKYYSLGKFIASGRKVPRTGGIILANVLNRDTLDAILSEDPFNMAGLAHYEVTEFIPTMVGEGFDNIKNCI
ncbi:YciI family protein [Moritella sp.]|uniref:YciI family protein n=1 Tax=Moritella sp. TaxID=78556 RepID=UPI001DF8BBBE|nr:YciI family protein [Moritella sp.]MCJ8351431.1 YciI family protein [Moritella sp.]NQZ40189.1 GTP cyclohydrolase [Moritella sp.]